MALWNELGKKASSTTAKAVHQAKVMGGTSKINTLILEENKKIEEIYTQLGKAYAQIHRDDYESCFGELVEMVKLSERKISEYNAQLNTLRGVVNCLNCGAELPQDAAFCSVCGAGRPQAAKPVVHNGVTCVHCGKALPEGVKFCTGCGAPMNQKAPEPVYVVEDRTVEFSAYKEKICVSCGAILDDDTAFCVECGAPVAGATETAINNVGRFCVVCGAKLDDDAVFCTECGTKL